MYAMKKPIAGNIQLQYSTTIIPILVAIVASTTHIDGRTIEVVVNSSYELEEALKTVERKPTHNEFVITLDSSVGYYVSGGMFTSISNTEITIQSSNRYTANITCCSITVNENKETRGFAFTNSTVKLDRLRFIRCGTNLSLLAGNRIIDTLIPKTKIHAVALAFIHSMVVTRSTIMNGSHGFAIFGYNLVASQFETLTIHNSLIVTRVWHPVEIGNGMLLYFDDHWLNNTASTDERRVTLTQCTFRNNTNVFRNSGSRCIFNYFTNGYSKLKSQYAAGLSVLYTQRLYAAEVNITGTKFINNTGGYAGAVFIINTQNVLSFTTLNQAVFANNALRTCRGADIHFAHMGGKKNKTQRALLTIEDTIFLGGYSGIKETNALGSVLIQLYTSTDALYFTFINMTFVNQNTPEIEGTCFKIKMFTNSDEKNGINVYMADITVTNNNKKYNQNIPRSMIYFENIKNVTLGGMGRFINNLGSAIHAKECQLYLTGNMTFINNTAENGAAILAQANIQLHFMPGLHAKFINNQAYYSGGAVYVRSTSHSECAITMHKGAQFHFEGNTATTAGNTMFLSPASKCKSNKIYHRDWLVKYLKYFNFTRFHQPNSLLQLSTQPAELAIRRNDQLHFLKTILTYPGQTLIFEIAALDYIWRKVFSFINIQLFKIHPNYKDVVWLMQRGGNQVLEQDKNTQMNISIHTNSTAFIQAKLVFSIPDIDTITIYVNMAPCPIGFKVDKISGICECDSLLERIPETTCSIDNRLIETRTNKHIWIGTVNKTTLAISLTCPRKYCTTVLHNGFIDINRDGEVAVLKSPSNNIVPLCEDNRVGILCGQCNHTAQYSAVFGSTECQRCSNLWLLTMIIYAVAGPLLVYTLFKLNLTVTRGTINGIVFYVQGANAGILEYLMQSYQGDPPVVAVVNKISHAVLSLLNLNLPFPLCFYNGMNQMVKTGLSLVFPVYLLVIVVVIIIVSRHSTWVSNRTADLSLQVLITTVHLSFSKLLVTFMEIFTSAKIETRSKTQHVWFWDGSVEYMSSAHFSLVIITVATVSVLLIPYIVILIMGKPLVRLSKRANFYLRPFLEAVYGPYRNNKYHWFVGRLLLLIILYITYVLLRADSRLILNIVSSILLILFTVSQAFTHPYKTSALNVLDTWLMVNFSLANGMIWTEQPSSIALTLVTIVILLAVCTIFVVLFHHILNAFSCFKRVQNRLHLLVDRVKETKIVRILEQYKYKDNEPTIHLLKQTTDSYYSSCNNYREPLLVADVD